MKMFPHPFVPFPDVDDKAGKPAAGSQVDKQKTPDLAARGATLKIDVENAVEIMLSASNSQDSNQRQEFRLKVIKTLPSDAIDWDTVDWAQLCAFQSKRR